MSKQSNNNNTQNDMTINNPNGEYTIDKMEKYKNYRTQFQRLKRAMSNEFYLEAIVIEYAIMEDRVESILSYEGNKIIPRNERENISIMKKINRIVTLAQQKNSLIGRYFAINLKNKINLMEEMKKWIDNRTPVKRNSVCRNNIIHHLLEIITTTEDLGEIAEKGNILCRDLTNRANNYKRMVERKKAKQEK